MPHSNLKYNMCNSEFIIVYLVLVLNDTTTYSVHQVPPFLNPPFALTSDGPSKPALFASLTFLESAGALVWSLTSLCSITVALSKFRI